MRWTEGDKDQLKFQPFHQDPLKFKVISSIGKNLRMGEDVSE
jgi:hypothetical protein